MIPETRQERYRRYKGHVVRMMLPDPLRHRHRRRCQLDWLEHHPPPFPDLPYHIELVISYADMRYHQGTAYLASGFTLHGFNDWKALYYRRLKPPLKSWLSLNHRPVQLTLLPNTPLRYGR